jgi:hypothetical protein
LRQAIKFALSLVFLLALAVVCYRRPIADDFDRYIYEAIVLGRSQTIETVYEEVKHESPRSEASSVLDSPRHLRELEPLYAIRPFYIWLISLVSTLAPIQHAINLISAGSLFGIGVVVLLWTRKPLQVALLMAAYPVLNLGRMGTPDGLAALMVLSALWLIQAQARNVAGVVTLLASLGVRTDNVLILLAVLLWLAWEQRISRYLAGFGAVLGVGAVLLIDHMAGNYGWMVLFRYSFIGGKYPANLPHALTAAEYGSAFLAGVGPALTQLSVWILIGLWAWMRRPSPLLWVASAAVIAHFLLFPSPETRYFMWAGILVAVMLISSFSERETGKTLVAGEIHIHAGASP